MAQQVRTAPDVATGHATHADPAPLGLAAFAMTTFVLSVMNAGLINVANTPIVLGLAFFYGGLAQLLAGMWEFRAGNTFGATAFTSFGAFWLSYAAISIPAFNINVTKLPNVGQAVGLYLLGWAIFTGIMMIGSLRLNGALAGVFIALFLTFICLCIGAFSGSKFWDQLGGWLGILTAIIAWYTAMAGMLRGVTGGRMSLPTFPLS